jgi:hypothetical protein
VSKFLAGETNRIFGVDLCRALGIDPNVTTGVTFTIHFDGPAHVTIERFVSTDEAPGILEVVARYHLVPIEDDEP